MRERHARIAVALSALLAATAALPAGAQEAPMELAPLHLAPLHLAQANRLQADPGQSDPAQNDPDADLPPIYFPPGAGAEPDPADDPPLDAETFDALTRGTTQDTLDALSGRYGIETFLSGRRVIWRDVGSGSDRCMHGTWEPVGEQICFFYETDPERPVCWTYHDRGDHIVGYYQGNRDNVPILLVPMEGRVSCDIYVGA
ncbi:hypothetical protein [Pseudogemmobacter sonorensis]|uniref:hypothetical protein n=1 Tax=Pseudogemmobacter sonorensis TaxID=2989681 RepID=UPI00369BD0CE